MYLPQGLCFWKLICVTIYNYIQSYNCDAQNDDDPLTYCASIKQLRTLFYFSTFSPVSCNCRKKLDCIAEDLQIYLQTILPKPPEPLAQPPMGANESTPATEVFIERSATDEAAYNVVHVTDDAMRRLSGQGGCGWLID